MKAIKLTLEDYKRSLKAKMNHLWLYNRNETTQRTHNNSIFLGRTIGQPFACLVVEYDKCICDEDIENIFGKGVFYDGGVSPNAKEKMSVDCFYVKGL
jgi:hypothetical protein